MKNLIVAKRIAFALKDDNVTEVEKNNVKIFILSMNGKKYVICSALGHLYTVGDPTKNRHIYPVFDIEWFPADAFNKKIQSSKRIKIIHELSSGADLFINACDFDLEGETIGYNILKYACGEKQETSFRAEFSTLTEDELKESFMQVERRVADGLAKAVELGMYWILFLVLIYLENQEKDLLVAASIREAAEPQHPYLRKVR